MRFFVTSLGNPRWVVDAVAPAGGVVYHDVTERKWALKARDGGVHGLIGVNDRAGGHAGARSAPALLEERGRPRAPGAVRRRDRRRTRLRGGAAHGLRRRPDGHALHRHVRVLGPRGVQARHRGRRRRRHRADRAGDRGPARRDPHAARGAGRDEGRAAGPLPAARPADEALGPRLVRRALGLAAEALQRARRHDEGLLAGGEERGGGGGRGDGGEHHRAIQGGGGRSR